MYARRMLPSMDPSDNREEPNGTDRQAEEDSRDPSTDEGTIPTDAPAGPVYSFSFYSRPEEGASSDLKAPEPKPLEVVHSDMPILAHRIAFLRFDGQEPFASLNGDYRFGQDADAICHNSNSWMYVPSWKPPTPHEAPHQSCTCGFYALPVDIEPWDVGAEYVTLMVELSGRVVEHDQGYRAQHQRIIECQFAPCPYCRAKSEVILANYIEESTMACCAKHVPAVPMPGTVVLTPDEVEHFLGIRVTCQEVTS